MLCRPRRPFTLALATSLLLVTATFARAQDDRAPHIRSIVVFGDSLSDTGNVAHLSELKYGIRIPSPAGGDYTDGRFTDGYDTLPAARDYTGVWIEQLAGMLPAHPVIKNSLDGGTDYAYAFAFTGNGTTPLTFGPSDSLSVTVDNIGQQITDYLATHPHIDNRTLFIVWGGANDVINAHSPDDVFTAAVHESLDIQRLIDAGATQFIVPNLPPLGLIPRLNGSTATSTPANQASGLYNDVLNLGLSILREFNPGHRLHLRELDVFTLYGQLVASPAAFGFTNVTASSQGLPTVDPDNYLFWDDLHPTTHGHNIVAINAWKLLTTDDTCAASRHHDRDAVPCR